MDITGPKMPLSGLFSKGWSFHHPQSTFIMTAGVLICLANVDCPTGFAKCGGESPRPACIYADQLCDGYNDCGNNWDEINETCGRLNIIDLAVWFLLINFIDWSFHSMLNLHFITKSFSESKFAYAHQISLKSGNHWMRYSDKTIFKMAAVRHHEFSKCGILVTWPVFERDFTSSYQFSRYSDIN